MPTVMITGASRGIGREFVRQYLDAGWDVIATCRNPEGAGYGDGEALQLDIADPINVKNLSEQLSGKAIDLLINNAGVNLAKNTNIGTFDYESWDEIFWVNVLAPLRIAELFIPNIKISERKQIVFLSSIMASLEQNTGGMPVYRSSKAALNQAVLSITPHLRLKGITTLLIHPGWVKTDMGGPNAAIDVQTSVSGMRETFESLTLDRSGSYVNYDGKTIPW